MLNLIYGPPQSGKTQKSDSLLINELKKGNKVTLIVPEQEVIDTENRIYDKAAEQGVILERLTVVSFGRLANLAFRKHGGIAYKNIGDAGKMILIYTIISTLSPQLKIYNKASDRSLIELMFNVCEELKLFSVLPSSLARASENATTEALADKLSDVSQIYTLYCAELSTHGSDRTDDISRLAEIYRTEKPDENEVFFIDSFNGFTTAELNVIKALIKSCNVTVTVNKPMDNGRLGFKTVEKTERQLLELAKTVGTSLKKVTDLYDTGTPENEFTLIRDKLYDFSYKSDENYSSPNITLATCSDPFAQAEFIAINVCKLIRNGARYRDIAVITRNTDKYDGVLDVIFEKYGIPLFLSKRDRITRTSIFKSVYTALDIISGGYRTEDIMSYIKNNILGFSAKEIDILEGYVSLWCINGSRWTDENDWAMRSDGFTDNEISGTDRVLVTVNSLKNKIISPLKELAEDLKNVTISEGCTAIYKFICKSGILSYYENSGDSSDITAYNTFIDMLDSLSELGMDFPASISEIASLLYLMAKNTDFGSIPSTLDRVTAGDASIIRGNGIKHVFLTDCENGIFPASISDESFFSDEEKEFLKNYNAEISPCVEEKNDLEAFYFLRSACSATQTLTATLCSHGSSTFKSIGFQRLSALFPKNDIITYPSDALKLERLQTRATVNETLRAVKGTPIYDIILDEAQKQGIDLFVGEIPISEPKITISHEFTKKLFGNNLILSSSSFEKYVKCPFNYFCTKKLHLKERKYNFFMANDMGSHIHRILELTVQKLLADKSTEEIANISAQDINAEINTATNNVLKKILGDDTSNEGKRFEALLKRLKRTLTIIVTNIINEFKSSDFKPKFFELHIGDKNGAIPPLEIKTKDGKSIKIIGVIDRVDVYFKDNKLYVRVVDYKSGTHEHSINNIKYGLDTQMPLYLFSLWKSGSKEFLSLIKSNNVEKDKNKKFDINDETTIVPAGLLYQNARLTVTKQATPASDEESQKNAEINLKRKGVLLEDQDVLNAMEHGLEGKFLPVKLENNKLKASKDILKSYEDFDLLFSDIKAVIKDYTEKMICGNASAIPMTRGGIDPCKYCQLYPICRSKNSSEN